MQKIIEEYQIYYGKWILFKDIKFLKNHDSIFFWKFKNDCVSKTRDMRWDNWKRNVFYIIQKCQVFVES